MSPSFATSDSANGTLTVSINGLDSSDARGETFDLTNSGLACGSAFQGLTRSDFNPKTTALSFPVARADENGSCQVTIQLVENASTKRSPAYFGGNPSRSASGSVTIPVPTLDTTQDQFKANFVAQNLFGHPSMAVSFTANDADQKTRMEGATGWRISLSNDGGTTFACGGTTASPVDAPVQFDVNTSCVQNATNWVVKIDFSYYSSPDPAYQVAVTAGNFPAPVDPAQMSFTVAYEQSALPGQAALVTTYHGPYPQSTLDLLQWTETITADSAPGVCDPQGQPESQTPVSLGSNTFQIDTGLCPTTKTPTSSGGTASPTTYTIVIHFFDPVYKTAHDYTYQQLAS
ncbi:MAG: hypothetical protein ACRDWT_01290 [Jatrophihabitantaceae bacterium]